MPELLQWNPVIELQQWNSVTELLLWNSEIELLLWIPVTELLRTAADFCDQLQWNPVALYLKLCAHYTPFVFIQEQI